MAEAKKNKGGRPQGRPDKYTEELADEICALIAQGRSMNSISKQKEMPCLKTFFNWLGKHESFLHKYEKAKQESADLMVEDMLEIADGVNSDGDTQRDRLRVDARKWVSSKLKPKKYGDRIQQDVQINNYADLSTEERLSKIAQLQQSIADEQQP